MNKSAIAVLILLMSSAIVGAAYCLVPTKVYDSDSWPADVEWEYAVHNITMYYENGTVEYTEHIEGQDNYSWSRLENGEDINRTLGSGEYFNLWRIDDVYYFEGLEYEDYYPGMGAFFVAGIVACGIFLLALPLLVKFVNKHEGAARKYIEQRVAVIEKSYDPRRVVWTALVVAGCGVFSFALALTSWVLTPDKLPFQLLWIAGACLFAFYMMMRQIRKGPNFWWEL